MIGGEDLRIEPGSRTWQEVRLEGITADEIPDVMRVTVVAGVTYRRSEKGEKACDRRRQLV